VASTYNIAPIGFSSFGIFANHSSEPNMNVVRVLSSKGIIIILKAKRDITEGEELTYNYNSEKGEYDVSFSTKVQKHINPYIEIFWRVYHILSATPFLQLNC
jgi:hypothetical protein